MFGCSVGPKHLCLNIWHDGTRAKQCVSNLSKRWNISVILSNSNQVVIFLICSSVSVFWHPVWLTAEPVVVWVGTCYCTSDYGCKLHFQWEKLTAHPFLSVLVIETHVSQAFQHVHTMVNNSTLKVWAHLINVRPLRCFEALRSVPFLSKQSAMARISSCLHSPCSDYVSCQC